MSANYIYIYLYNPERDWTIEQFRDARTGTGCLFRLHRGSWEGDNPSDDIWSHYITIFGSQDGFGMSLFGRNYKPQTIPAESACPKLLWSDFKVSSRIHRNDWSHECSEILPRSSCVCVCWSLYVCIYIYLYIRICICIYIYTLLMFAD